MSTCYKHPHNDQQVGVSGALCGKNDIERSKKASFWSLEVASPSAEECERFGQLVKLRLRDINGFVKLKRVLEAYKTGEINRLKVVDCVQVVFGHHRDLLEGFKMFLPRELHNHLMRVGEEQSEQSKLEIGSAHDQDSDYFSESDCGEDSDQHEVEWSGDDDDEITGPSRGGEMRPSPPLSVGPAEDEWGVSEDRRVTELRAQIPQSSIRERINAGSTGSNWGIVSDVLASNRVVDVKSFDESAAIVSDMQTTRISSHDSVTPEDRYLLDRQYSPLIIDSDFSVEPLAAHSTFDLEDDITTDSCLFVVHSMVDRVCDAVGEWQEVHTIDGSSHATVVSGSHTESSCEVERSIISATTTILKTDTNTNSQSTTEWPPPSVSPGQIIPTYCIQPSSFSPSSSPLRECDGDEFLDYSTDSSSAFSGEAQSDNYSDNCSESGGDHGYDVWSEDTFRDTDNNNASEITMDAERCSVTETHMLFDSNCSSEVESEEVESVVCTYFTTENDPKAGSDGNSDDEVWRDGVLLQTKKGVTNSLISSGEWSDVISNDSSQYYSKSIREGVEGSIVDIYDNLSLNNSSNDDNDGDSNESDSGNASVDGVDSRWCDTEKREGMCFFPTSDRVTELDQDSEPLTTCNVSSTLSDDMSVDSNSSSVGDIQSVDSSEVNEEELEEVFKEVHEEVAGCGEVELLAAQGLLSAINVASVEREQDEEQVTVLTIAQLEALLCSGDHSSSSSVETNGQIEAEENARRRTEPRLNVKSAPSPTVPSVTATEPATLFVTTTTTLTCGKMITSKKGGDYKALTEVVCAPHRPDIATIQDKQQPVVGEKNKKTTLNKRKFVSETAVRVDMWVADGRNTRSRGGKM